MVNNTCALRPQLVQRADTFLFVVMEFCEEGSLMHAICDDGNIQICEYTDWTIELTRGLEHMSGLKVIHRDIKPEKYVHFCIAVDY